MAAGRKHRESHDPGTRAVRYVIVSPVKDEESYVELTLRSVTDQTARPVAWILVDDGSKDRTPEIIGRYAEAHPFVRLVRRERAGARGPGSAVIRAFNAGFEALADLEYGFIVKLDCDLSFGPDYFERLLGRFSGDTRLGIASGIYLERGKGGAWREIGMPSYHAAGACKVVRRQCFEDIGGFIASAGWDTVDEIRAMTRGWRTLHDPELRMRHHKPEGSGIGRLRTSMMHGEVYYLTGGDKLFFALKLLRRVAAKPYLLNALALIGGYVRALWKRKGLLVTDEEASCYQDLLRARMAAKVKMLIGWN